MQKTSQQLVDSVLQKCAFSVTERGHAFDADEAALRKRYFMDMARRLQEEDALGYHDPETDKAHFGSLLSALRFGGDGHPVANARHQAYVEKKHREGGNAWNPLGGTLTPIPEEEGATSGLLGHYGKVRGAEPKTASVIADRAFRAAGLYK